MYKKFLVTMLSSLMILSIVGCGQKEEPVVTESEVVTESVEEIPETEPEEPLIDYYTADEIREMILSEEPFTDLNTLERVYTISVFEDPRYNPEYAGDMDCDENGTASITEKIPDFEVVNGSYGNDIYVNINGYPQQVFVDTKDYDPNPTIEELTYGDVTDYWDSNFVSRHISLGATTSDTAKILRFESLTAEDFEEMITPVLNSSDYATWRNDNRFDLDGNGTPDLVSVLAFYGAYNDTKIVYTEFSAESLDSYSRLDHQDWWSDYDGTETLDNWNEENKDFVYGDLSRLVIE